MSNKTFVPAAKWVLLLVVAFLLATTTLAAAQSPDLHLPLVTHEGQTDPVAPDTPIDEAIGEAAPPLVEELDPNALVGDSQDTHSSDYDVPAEMAAVDAFNATQWTVQNNVGIGTQTPTADIDLARNVNNYTRIWVRNPNAGANVQTQLYLNTAGSDGLVAQQFGSGYTATWNGKSLKTMARLRTTPTVKGLILTTGGSYPLILGTADQERMRITSDGKVGIGTTTPAHKLSIAGGPQWTVDPWSGVVDLPNISAIAWRANSAGTSFGMGHSNNGFHLFRTTDAPGTTASSPTYDLTIDNAGSVGIGTLFPQAGAKLHVVGTARFESGPGQDGVVVPNPGRDGVFVYNPGSYGVRVECPCGNPIYPYTGVFVLNGDMRVQNGTFTASGTSLNVPDYVFEPEYPLMSLDELRAYVAEEKHLPNVPDEEEIRTGGLDLSDFQMKLLEKTEELTLYTLAQDEQIKSLQAENQAMQQTNQSQGEQLVAQSKQLEALQQENEAMQEENRAMQEMIADLEERLAALEAQE